MTLILTPRVAACLALASVAAALGGCSSSSSHSAASARSGGGATQSGTASNGAAAAGTTAAPASDPATRLANSEQDTAAKELARSAQVAAETTAAANSGSYAGLDLNALAEFIPDLATRTQNAPYLSAVTGTSSTFTVTALSPTGDSFSVSRGADGTITRTCRGSATGACRAGSW